MAEATAPRRRVRSAVLLAATVVGVGLTAALGLWQLDRAEQKKAMQRAIDARAQAAPLNGRALSEATAVAASGAEPVMPEALRHRRASLVGQWAVEHTLYLENRPMDGRTGFFVLTPLRLSDRPGDAVLVQRGWAPRHAADRRALPPVRSAPGEVRISGRLASEASRVYALGQASEAGPIRQNVDLSSLRRELRISTGLHLLPVVLLQDEPDGEIGAASMPPTTRVTAPLVTGPGAATSPADGLWRHWPAPTVDLHKHYGYAFQWFALAALILGLYVWFQLLVPRRRARRRDADAAAP